MLKKIIISLSSIFLIIGVVYLITISKEYNIKEGVKYGKENAAIKILEYSSFQCGSCKELHDEIGDELKEYIKDGTVEYTVKFVDIERFEYDDVIFKHISENDLKNINKINEIFKKQDKWKKLNSKEEVIDYLNLNEEPNEKHLEEYLWKREELLEMDIRSVPSVYINGNKIEGKIKKQEFIDIINQELMKNN
ncbi:MAG: thioredoxin domain-containing protein [Romboutsia sp.]|nr:thioredoxin domain-containing protein [Romboutsia sp.]